jgi:hypothetical protein
MPGNNFYEIVGSLFDVFLLPSFSGICAFHRFLFSFLSGYFFRIHFCSSQAYSNPAPLRSHNGRNVFRFIVWSWPKVYRAFSKENKLTDKN